MSEILSQWSAQGAPAREHEHGKTEQRQSSVSSQNIITNTNPSHMRPSFKLIGKTPHSVTQSLGKCRKREGKQSNTRGRHTASGVGQSKNPSLWRMPKKLKNSFEIQSQTNSLLIFLYFYRLRDYKKYTYIQANSKSLLRNMNISVLS